MSNRVLNKVILVTGGTSGIGESATRLLAQEGAKVIFAGRNISAGKVIEDDLKDKGLQGKFIKADMLIENDIYHLFQFINNEYGILDCAFNNAGIEGNIASFHESTKQNWLNVFDMNLHSIWDCMQQEIKMMLKNQSGSIINMSSTSGLVGNGLGLSAYAASKHAIIGLTKSTALEYARQGIRINAICPGFIDTPMVRRCVDLDNSLAKKITYLEPIGRIGRPDEIASSLVYLCSAESSFMTGNAMIIDGGLTTC